MGFSMIELVPIALQLIVLISGQVIGGFIALQVIKVRLFYIEKEIERNAEATLSAHDRINLILINKEA